MVRALASLIFLDTHVVLWLYAGLTERLSANAVEAIESDSPAVSPVVILELAFLKEVERVTVEPGMVLGDLSTRIGLMVHDLALSAAVSKALDLDWTRDPFDRLIVGHTAAAGARLVTKDEIIRNRFPHAVW